jgi:hypothetical protein
MTVRVDEPGHEDDFAEVLRGDARPALGKFRPRTYVLDEPVADEDAAVFKCRTRDRINDSGAKESFVQAITAGIG